MLFELRRYMCRPGKRDAWIEVMETRIIPLQIAKGMAIVGSFVDEEDPDAYVWIRRFESEAERVRLYAAVYQSEEWTSGIAPLVGDLVDRDRIQVTRLTPTAVSALH